MSRLPGTLSNFASKFPGGKFAFMECAQWSSDERVKRMCEIWNESSANTKYRELSMDALAKEAGIDPLEAAGIVVTAALRYSRLETDAIASAAAPSVVTRNVEEALKPEGIADRKMFLEHTGYLPTPKGAVVNQQFNQLSVNDGFKSFESSVTEIAGVIRGDD